MKDYIYMGHGAKITDELIKGDPLTIESILKTEIANQILKMGAFDYENVCFNMRLIADIFEILEDNINKEEITLKYNPMGSWYLDEEDQDETI